MESIWSTENQTISGIRSAIYKVSVFILNRQRKRKIFFEFSRYIRIWYRLKKARRRAHMDFLNPIPLQQIYGRVVKEISSRADHFHFSVKVHRLVDWVAEQSVEVFEENSVVINSYLVSMNFKLSKQIRFVCSICQCPPIFLDISVR